MERVGGQILGLTLPLMVIKATAALPLRLLSPPYRWLLGLFGHRETSEVIREMQLLGKPCEHIRSEYSASVSQTGD